jgi:hypothetical protein
MSAHVINECKHGVMVSQCRCPGPLGGKKPVVIVNCPSACAIAYPPSTAAVDRPYEFEGGIPNGCCCDVHKVGGVGCGMCPQHDVDEWTGVSEEIQAQWPISRYKAALERIAAGAAYANNHKHKPHTPQNQAPTCEIDCPTCIAVEALK